MSLAQLEKLKELGDLQSTLALECVDAHKRLEALEMDHRMNEESTKQSCDLLQMTNEKVQETTMKTVEVDTEICKARDALMKLDEELNYMETCNDRHKQSQGLMLERMSKETAHFQEQTIRLHDAEVQLGQQEKEQDALRLEIDGLRCSSED